ncbi:TOBE-like domain-containing protein [Rickettsiales bacterium]|nr:TOBE-like domain-containing protein [Rickettsiales bacterium]
MAIKVQNINKYFSGIRILKDINLNINSGELIALIGPSGSGKTTLLRIIAGLEFANSGDVFLGKQNVNNVHIKDRDVGFVFQNYALFKNMNVFDNIAFGLKVGKRKKLYNKEQIKTEVDKLLDLIRLKHLSHRYPSELSGGQRQRVALARSLAIKPKYLLLDEPFGALDAKVRKELRTWLRRLHNETDITTIFVTHDQEEAMEVADKIVVMGEGRIQQIGDSGDIYHKPNNMFVYNFLGEYNEFAGFKDSDGELHLSTTDKVNFSQEFARKIHPRNWINKYVSVNSKILAKKIGIKNPEKNIEPNKSKPKKSKDSNYITIFARPHEMHIDRKREFEESIESELSHVNPAGFSVKLEFQAKNIFKLIQVEITHEFAEELNLKIGDIFYIRPKKLRTFE